MNLAIVVEHRDRFCRFGSDYVQGAGAAQGGELVVVDSSEVDEDLVREMTEILTSTCARLWGSALRRTAPSAPWQLSGRPRFGVRPDGEV